MDHLVRRPSAVQEGQQNRNVDVNGNLESQTQTDSEPEEEDGPGDIVIKDVYTMVSENSSVNWRALDWSNARQLTVSSAS